MHKKELDDFTPAEMRVVTELLLHTMDYVQRMKFMQRLPGLYVKIYPGTETRCIEEFAAANGIKVEFPKK